MKEGGKGDSYKRKGPRTVETPGERLLSRLVPRYRMVTKIHWRRGKRVKMEGKCSNELENRNGWEDPGRETR